ncbi:MAG TPA: BTAD domain-containing putative transcriptional regulator [Anaerolineales bacterium]|nr:BTAD domain-containing putative transcriptional regulator [Anaerolineales bacterium]
MHLLKEGDSSDIRLPRGVQELFAYLLLEPHRTHSREVLAGRLWDDFSQDRARYCLNTALWRLRRIIEPEGLPRGTYLTTTPDGEIGFNSNSDYWLDIEDFKKVVDHVLDSPPDRIRTQDLIEMENHLSLYTGDLLEGMYIDWILREREHVRMMYLNSLAYLMSCYKSRGEYGKSLTYGLKLLEFDPLREEIHREVMRLYQVNGQRALALRQFEACQKILLDELGVSPMEETRALYQAILMENDSRPATPGRRDHQRLDLENSLKTLNDVLQSFLDLQGQLRQTIQQLRDEMQDEDG